MKHVAGPRSVETLVDFSRGNLRWFKRDQKRKAPEENGDIIDAAQQDPIDPNLEQASGFTAANTSPRNKGRSLATATTNVDDSNTTGSVQAELRDHDAGVNFMGSKSRSRAAAPTRRRSKGKKNIPDPSDCLLELEEWVTNCQSRGTTTIRCPVCIQVQQESVAGCHTIVKLKMANEGRKIIAGNIHTRFLGTQ
jgi:hypothetical protein